VPGPGAYEYNYNHKSNSHIKFGTSTRNDAFKMENPGPGSYDYHNKQHLKGITISGFKGKQNIN